MNTYYTIKNQMSQVWDKNGKRLAITILDTKPLTVTQVKSKGKDKYDALQIGFGTKRSKNMTDSLKKHLKVKKTDKTTVRYIREIKYLNNSSEEFKNNDKINLVDVFQVGDVVNATGTSKGKGFAGAIKRWGFAGGPRTHGQSDRARAVGSIGQGTDPGRVHKGKKMPGRLGTDTKTIKNLQVVHINPENQQIWLNGPIPGHRGSVVKLVKVRTKEFVGLDPKYISTETQIDNNNSDKE